MGERGVKMFSLPALGLEHEKVGVKTFFKDLKSISQVKGRPVTFIEDDS